MTKQDPDNDKRRFLAQYAERLLRQVNGSADCDKNDPDKPDVNIGVEPERLPQPTRRAAAIELISLAEAEFRAPDGHLPDAVRQYLQQAFEKILDGTPAEKALSIQVSAGRKNRPDEVSLTALANYVLLLRQGKKPAEAKSQTRTRLDVVFDGGKGRDWMDKLVVESQDTINALMNMTTRELEAAADVSQLKG